MKKLSEYPVVNSLEGLNPYTIYQTTRGNLFKKVEGNRGEEKGSVAKKVRKLIELMDNNEFYYDLSVLVVNKSGELIDGNHRYMALIEKEMPILFRVVTNPIYNLDRATLLSIIAKINDINPSWSSKEIFLTAFLLGSALAKTLKEYRSKITESTMLNDKDLTYNLLMTLVERNPSKTHSEKRTISEYFDPKHTKYCETKQFKDELKYVCKVMVMVKKITTIDANRIIEQLLYLMWTEKNFDRDAFLKALESHSFNLIGGRITGKMIRAKIMELSFIVFTEIENEPAF